MPDDTRKTKRTSGGARNNVAGRPRPHRKLTIDVKEAIAKAFELSGGVDYLVQVARDDPRVFCALLQKIIPTEVKAEVNVSGKLIDAIQEGRRRSGITIDQDGNQC
jgi:hypothetical protein